ncbi:MAG: NAD(P)-dependent glycerol-3-phosphate dehydrogenase [Hoeflea sp.]|uniref:NAD(P)H-dependent glycerol-3-phosphate dehydrogenase n=1 Tax=Hoeflea sp. TaxID=1940281 RepID=UPI001D3D1A8A|nr:NAD(P)H-dependent glycerol-3-phosphate dehydrogenase [Hoeflea sp.]MBU4531610.1 NAD(P)-dependent glycerol-3-phosphate dehydrogenase [Alphaproteobacteria bacterium]MBU4544467.1 NAD(P)-dependent glycerol-3-phosphate dehydrogenase [Alphaproteobacteria bacterium]MBU4552698.1 NAD(P)-dependent glycerol-3-phosphate dehydrogenase [Alphaproteobacteria bacterium]MBV1724886.1 NAD(P)-dependent glycerol-3-phosphate dehydrogenase [Hoeflea sp.]MBV1760906.1 NAD(P)-dependent glycerol-3-phosphate dehydrogenas
MSRISILGAGAWGTALAAAFVRQGHHVRIWGRNARTCDEITDAHTNRAYLGDARLPDALEATPDMARALEKADIVLFVAPAQSTGEVAAQAAAHLPAAAVLIACAKGIDNRSGQMQSEVIADKLPDHSIGVLSGPSFAADVVRGLPTAVTLAMPSLADAQSLAESLSGDAIRLYASDDVTGVQVGGSLKNVMAIAVGICRGGGMGASAEAALITRGYAELSRLSVAMGARPETLMGLSGLGDLVLTCSSELSRNFAYGIAVGSGRDVSGLKLAEGVYTVTIANEIADRHKISCPIMKTADLVLSGRMSADEARMALMSRPVKAENPEAQE